MESFEEILTVGGHTNSLGRAGEVFRAVQNDTSKMDELFECIKAEDAWVRMRAIDTFEKIVKDNPELAQPYLPSIFADLSRSSQPSIQWHLAQIFVEVKLTREQQDDAISWLKKRITTTDVDWIVSVNTMKALLIFCAAGVVSKEDLLSLFEIQAGHQSKSVRKKAGIFLEELRRSL